MSDAALVEQASLGDKNAFTLIMNRWQKRIHRFAYRYFGNSTDADEITQKTFIRVYEKLDSLDDPGKFSSWIYQIANNLCLDELKRAGRRNSENLSSHIFNSNFIEKNSPAVQVEQKELSKMIEGIVLTLPEEQRVVLILKEFEGLKFREIAEILGEPEGTVKTRLYTGLTALKKKLSTQRIFNEYLNYD
ncbi:MAG: RNA polymerase sigma factor [Balneolaceae bacterium]|nr:RNA polymerase sigma factor [Balneolaceae bacterium]